VDIGASIIIQACHAISAETGQPSVPLIVAQRLRRWHEEGKVAEDRLVYARALLTTAEANGDLPDPDAFADELAPVLRRIAEREALDAGFDAFGKKRDLTKMEALLAGSRRIGVTNTSAGLRIGTAALDQVFTVSRSPRLPTGIQELDAAMRGGVKRKTLSLVMGGPNDGKSCFLDQVVSEAISSKRPAALATLEMSSEEHHARILANLCDIPIDDAAEYEDSRKLLRERLELLEGDGFLAYCTVKDFTARATTVLDIEQWLDAEEQASGVKIPVLAVDYAALLCDPLKKARHEEMTSIMESLRTLAVKRNLWLWSAHQTTGEGMDKKTKRVDNAHAAESKGVPRTVDFIVTLNNREGAEVLFFISKNRGGERGQEVGPLPTDWGRGRIVMGRRDGWPF